jgi:hypothetical protein
MENLTPFKRLLQKMLGTILYSWVLFSKIIQPSVRIYFSVEGDSGQVAKMEVEQLVGHSQWSGETNQENQCLQPTQSSSYIDRLDRHLHDFTSTVYGFMFIPPTRYCIFGYVFRQVVL